MKWFSEPNFSTTPDTIYTRGGGRARTMAMMALEAFRRDVSIDAWLGVSAVTVRCQEKYPKNSFWSASEGVFFFHLAWYVPRTVVVRKSASSTTARVVGICTR